MNRSNRGLGASGSTPSGGRLRFKLQGDRPRLAAHASWLSGPGPASQPDVTMGATVTQHHRGYRTTGRDWPGSSDDPQLIQLAGPGQVPGQGTPLLPVLAEDVTSYVERLRQHGSPSVALPSRSMSLTGVIAS
jgi:hypothetical protein